MQQRLCPRCEQLDFSGEVKSVKFKGVFYSDDETVLPNISTVKLKSLWHNCSYSLAIFGDGGVTKLNFLVIFKFKSRESF